MLRKIVIERVKIFFLICILLNTGFMHSIPPLDIPVHLHNDFTMGGMVEVSRWYRDDSYAANNPITYTREQIDANMQMIAERKMNYYGSTDIWLYEAIEKYIAQVQDKAVGIIGSTIPWYESIALYYGARPTTIEYNKIISQDSRLKVMTVEEYEQSPIIFDVLFSISSFEHDGLGRYGDPIDPIGDIKAMQKACGMLKKGGLLFLAVPVGRDRLFWNVHRVYGRLRLPMLIEGWDMIDSFGLESHYFDVQTDGSYQPVLVLRKK